MRRVLIVVSLFVGLVVLLAGASGAGSGSLQQRWVMRDLGTLGGAYSVAEAINERGQVAGTSRTATGERHVFHWRDGRIDDLGLYGWNARWPFAALAPDVVLNERGQVGWTTKDWRAKVWEGGRTTEFDRAVLFAINEQGQIAAFGATKSGEAHALLLQEGRRIDLGVLPGHEISVALALNDHGAVVGGSWTEIETVAAFLWREGRMRDLGTLPGHAESIAIAVNDKGQVLGASGNDESVHAFLWQNGTMTDIGPLGEEGSLTGLNERGQVIGARETVSGLRAFLWQDGEITDLGTLPGDKTSVALAINEQGQIVGRSTSASGATRAFVWQDGVMASIGRGRISAAFDINNEGQIVGYRGIGKTHKGSRVHHAVLWTPRQLTAR
jgi:probable HAF family extracellular repeat protein